MKKTILFLMVGAMLTICSCTKKETAARPTSVISYGVAFHTAFPAINGDILKADGYTAVQRAVQIANDGKLTVINTLLPEPPNGTLYQLAIVDTAIVGPAGYYYSVQIRTVTGDSLLGLGKLGRYNVSGHDYYQFTTNTSTVPMGSYIDTL